MTIYKLFVQSFLILFLFVSTSCKNNAMNKTMSYPYNDSLADVKQLILESSCKKNVDIQFVFNSISEENKIKLTFENNVLTIWASQQNRSIALYEFLNQVGFKFYGPEQHWTYIPDCVDYSSIAIDKTISNLFTIRSIGVSYGLGSRKYSSFEPIKQKWQLWQNRIQLQEPENMDWSHYGNKLNRKNKTIILENPQWFKGKFNNNTKLDYCNPEVVNLFLKDAKKRLSTRKNENHFYINMEPPDGDGYFDCKGKSISDQVFGLANQVANIYSDKNTTVWLLAYNEHANIPSFQLNPNLMVGIVPDAFQKVGSPEKLMSLWEESHSNLFLRGYLSIPVWSKDLPNWGNAKSYFDRIQHLKKKKYKGFKYESTISFMSAGWNQYVIARSAIDEDFNYGNEWDLFLKNMFGEQAEQVNSLLEVLQASDFEDYYLSYLFTEFESLKANIKDENRIKRYDDFLSYITYLQTYYQFINNKSEASKNQLLEVLSKDNSSFNIHSWALFNVLNLGKEYLNKPTKSIKFKTNNINTYQKVDKKIDLSFEKDIEVKSQNITSNKPINFSLKLTKPETLVISGKKYNKNGRAYITIYDSDKKIIQENQITLDQQPRSYSIPYRKKEIYIEIQNPNAELSVQVPNSKIVLTNALNGIDRKGYTFYFVPHKTEVAFSAPKNSTVSIYYNNILLSTKNIENSYEKFTIPEQYKNKILKIESSSNRVNRIDDEHRLSLFEESYFE